jgi:hypothetical protein
MDDIHRANKLVGGTIEFQIERVLEDIEAGKEYYQTTDEMTYEEYWGYLFGRWVVLQEMFQFTDVWLGDDDTNRISAKLDRLYEIVHRKIKPFDPFDL